MKLPQNFGKNEILIVEEFDKVDNTIHTSINNNVSVSGNPYNRTLFNINAVNGFPSNEVTR